MKTVLIVEDEKVIRQGIKAMITRSGVPVEVILECSNGEMALEVLKDNEVDLMFTDIRMPKMDGLELVRQVQTLQKKPIIVAVSGFDDFTYAVEMMRNGVREYILKPVEREKIKAILEKFEEELAVKQERDIAEQKIGYTQLKQLIEARRISSEEEELLIKKNENMFWKGEYAVCLAEKATEYEPDDRVIFLTGVEDQDLVIVEKTFLTDLLANEMSTAFVGVSKMHVGLGQLRDAFEEALEARGRAFCQEKHVVFAADEVRPVPEGLRSSAEKLISEAAFVQRVQLIGTERTNELIREWESYFTAIKKGHILAQEFFEGNATFLGDVTRIYKNVLDDRDSTILTRCSKPSEFSCISEYEAFLSGWILDLNNRIHHRVDSGKNQQKISEAVDYIKKHYAEDLNMAVVSNEFSMNYSLFSYVFKQYTGMNFVNYLKEIRMQEAKKLLAETDMKVIEISRAVGYDNEKNFMKVFKATTGVSAGEFRKNANL